MFELSFDSMTQQVTLSIWLLVLVLGIVIVGAVILLIITKLKSHALEKTLDKVRLSFDDDIDWIGKGFPQVEEGVRRALAILDYHTGKAQNLTSISNYKQYLTTNYVDSDSKSI